MDSATVTEPRAVASGTNAQAEELSFAVAAASRAFIPRATARGSVTICAPLDITLESGCQSLVDLQTVKTLSIGIGQPSRNFVDNEWRHIRLVRENPEHGRR